ncbi:hypothetical protein F4825DRAFT_401017 [Nemania diffusa]|nr:hypothetical protein F4825DRAFT_401017 [Nemania diffusa]
MADLQKPAPAKRGLPFKRRQRLPNEASSTADDDGLALFSQSKDYFPTVVEDQQRRAREKAEKAERERKEKLEREQEEADVRALEAQLRRERIRKEAEELEAEKGRESAKKRRRYSLPSDDEKQRRDEDDEEDDDLADRPSKSYKPSTPFSPESKRSGTAPRSSRGPESARKTRTSKQPETSIILLDSSDDEDSTNSRIRRGTSQIEAAHLDSTTDQVRVDQSDSDLEMWEDKKENNEGVEGGEEDPSEFYIKAAMERKAKAIEVPVSVMIAAPALPEAKALCCTVRTAQVLQIAFDTFKERLKAQTAYPHKMISELVFTWRGDRVYHTTKLETLGICPRAPDGRLHDNPSSGRGAPEGYIGKDKVYFEAWTPEDYEENQEKRERERKRREMGEWWDEEPDAAAAAAATTGDSDGHAADAGAEAKAEDDRVKVIFKAKDMPPRNVTLRKHSTVAQMIKAFRKLASLGDDKQIEIRWDGEVLDLETTVEEADIGDMDSVEVHIRG